MNKTAVISGLSGQDARYLAQLLLSKDYKVYGTMRRLSNPDMDFINECSLEDVELLEMDLADNSSIYKIISEIKPTEFYNLASMSHVGTSFNQPEHTANITGLGPLRILENIRLHSPSTKYYNAGSSEQFGNVPSWPQNENTPFDPQSPYAAAKVFSHHITKVYRHSYGIFACCGILQNHESPYRSKDFVTRKITSWIGQYVNRVTSSIKPLELGNLDSQRDWSHAKDMVRGMYLMMQQDKPDDFVLGSGESHSVREFCEIAFEMINIKLIWEGSGIDEVGKNAENGEILIKINPKFYRPLEVHKLQGDPSKAHKLLNWYREYSFRELIKEMVYSDIYVYSTDKTNYPKAFSPVTE